jgi:hypothetical protein
MINFTPVVAAAILSASIATPVLAQAAVQMPDAYVAYYRSDSDPEVRSAAGRGTFDATASVPPVRSWTVASETTTKPWPAPVGHRQPRAADLSASGPATPQTLDQEDADIDRKIRGVCRGC